LVTVRDASVYDLRPEKESYDAVALVGVIEHMPDHRQVLRIAAEQLRHGGHLYLSASAYRHHRAYREFADRPGSRHVAESIFGYAVLRPLSMLVAAAEGAGFSLSTLTDLTGHYHRTIEEWERRALANRPVIDAVRKELTHDLVRYFRVTNAGWGHTTKHYALSAVRARQGETVMMP
jgi:cyclopropane-fatty-acyl-phospholipid synthase